MRAYNGITEMSAATKADWSNHVSINYPLATELNSHSATTSYNCHAYAWHIYEGGDNVWIGYYQGQETDEDIYWTDGSYNIQNNETGADKISYYTGNHSAVQTSTQGTYKSKWGKGPLMSHSRNYGPSIYNMNYRKYYKSNPQPEISGPNTVCASNTTFIVQGANSASVTWQVSSNLTIVGSNSEESVLVKANTSSGTGFVRAVFDNYDVEKTVNVGVITNNFNLLPPPEFDRIDLSDGLEGQEYTNINWIVNPVSTGNFHIITDVSVYGTGTGNWFVTGYVEITNICGVVSFPFILVPNVYYNRIPCQGYAIDYRITKTGSNKYTVFNICSGLKEDISSSELYNIYGVKIQDIPSYQDEMEIGNKKNSRKGDIRIIRVNVNGEILAKTIIVD